MLAMCLAIPEETGHALDAARVAVLRRRNGGDAPPDGKPWSSRSLCTQRYLSLGQQFAGAHPIHACYRGPEKPARKRSAELQQPGPGSPGWLSARQLALA